MKKFIALLMTALMLLSVIPVTATAETLTDDQGVNYTPSDDGTYYIVSDFDESVTEVIIPSTYNGLPVKEIGNWAFYDCTGLTSITIPDSVTAIGLEPFRGCDALEVIEVSEGNTVYYSKNNCIIETETKTLISGCKTSIIPDDGSVTTIGDSAFSSCSGLTSITLPNSVTTIGYGAFAHCYGLTSITIPNSVTTIGYGAFVYCFGLTSITIPNSVTTIGDNAFSSCSGLTSITIGDSVTTIGDDTFSGCDALTSVTIPDSVTAIGLKPFRGCDALEVIEVSEGNTVYHSKNNCIIETETKTLISGCKTSIIPDDGSVTTIGDWAFSDCSGLTSVTIPDSITTIGYYAFYWCNGLTSITIPDSVTSIGESAFACCYDLTSITIPDSVTSIGDYAFEDCTDLTSITIPDSVITIGSSAFQNSWDDNLTDIYCEAPTKPRLWSEGWLDGCSATVHWGEATSEITYYFAKNITVGVDVRAEEAFEAGTTVTVEQLFDISAYNGTIIDLFKNILAVTVGANFNGKIAIPSGHFNMYFQIPEDFSESVAVFYADENGKISKVESVIDTTSGLVTVTTGKLGTYFLADTEGVELTTTGDINDNGEIDSLDYILLKRAYFGTFELSETAQTAGDINGNGEIDSLDYILLKRAYFGTYEIK